MDSRKKLILMTIVKEHIKTGVPVGSGVLVDKYKLNISPATARNEMAELEDDGFIMQPHISAGRIPTERAYDLYVENCCSENKKKLSREEIQEFEKSLKNIDEAELKQVAKLLAQKSNNAIFWAFHKHNLYYTGISNLLSPP